ncbi:hypothetical protein SAMN05444161_9061 [Rhizobiales bacterium GAS191]|nr:hypothetical protein SAMN05444161_9061 [Rhizobiales bacterium GAS191]
MSAKCGRRMLGSVFTVLVLCNWPCAAEDTPLPPNNLPCDAFIKKEDGSWFAKSAVHFDVGQDKSVTLESAPIMPKSQTVGGVDVYVLLDAKCGKTAG